MTAFRKILVAVEPSSAIAQFGDKLTGPSQHALRGRFGWRPKRVAS